MFRDPSTLIVRQHADVLALHPDTDRWIVDFERCIAWGWLTEFKA